MKTAEEYFYNQFPESPNDRKWDKFELRANLFDAYTMIEFAEDFAAELKKENEELRKSVTPDPFLYPINSAKLKELIWKLDREVWAKVEAKEATTSWGREQTGFLISQYFGQSSNELQYLRELISKCITELKVASDLAYLKDRHDRINQLLKDCKGALHPEGTAREEPKQHEP